MANLPTISIVTPSHNQAAFVQKCLDSIAQQTIQPHEHIIFDSVSTDGSAEIFRDYAKDKSWVDLTIAKDNGQMDAINRGFTAATGDIITWLNTDDFFIDNRVLEDIANFFLKYPEADFIYGRGEFLDQNGEYLQEVYINTNSEGLRGNLMHSVGILQPANFFRRSVFEDLGLLDESLSYCFDYEYWLRAAQARKKFVYVDRKFTQATLHPDSKTIGDRMISLRQTTQLSKNYYGFACYQWLDKLAQCLAHGSDGIVSGGKASREAEQKRKEVFMEFNGDKRSLSKLLSSAHLSDAHASIKYFKEQQILNTRRAYISSFDANFFASGLTMIAGLQKYHDDPYPIFIYDIGLSPEQREILLSLENVFVLDFEKDAYPFFKDYFDVKTYGFKSYAIWHARHYMNAGDSVIWMDGGIYPLCDMGICFEEIEDKDILLVDHDDKSIWPVWNSTFTSDECIVGMKATPEELMAPHLRAGFLGYKIGGKYAKMFQEAFEYSLRPEVLCGEKHPEPPIYKRRAGGTQEERRRAVEDKSWQSTLTSEKIRDMFGYFGHRHDQAIISILAARYGAPYSSAREFCVADNLSSDSSKARWKQGDQSDYNVTTEIPAFYKNSAAAMMQHRGLFINTTGLKFMNVDTSKPAVILGNGPSLAGFDFKRFHIADVVGMNAAYRYWDEINWYPQYYCCLDLVVGLSHKDEIKRLIETSHETGIRLFFLRQNLIDELGLLKNQERVINFDEIKRYSGVLQTPTITTGSHAAAFAALLGYKNIYILGVDCNYTEIIDGAKETGVGTELEIVEEKENPNYFFKGYQQKGDKYNIPNPNRNIHLDAWREIAGTIAELDCLVLNANLQSKVDAFDFCQFEDIESGREVKILPAFEVLQAEDVSVSAAKETNNSDHSPRSSESRKAETKLSESISRPYSAQAHYSPSFDRKAAGTKTVLGQMSEIVMDVLRRRFPVVLLYAVAVGLSAYYAFFTPWQQTPWPWLALAGALFAGFAAVVAIGFLYTKRRVSEHLETVLNVLRSEIALRAPTSVVQRVASNVRKVEVAGNTSRKRLETLGDEVEATKSSLNTVNGSILDINATLESTAHDIQTMSGKIASLDFTQDFRNEITEVYRELDAKASLAFVADLQQDLESRSKKEVDDKANEVDATLNAKILAVADTATAAREKVHALEMQISSDNEEVNKQLIKFISKLTEFSDGIDEINEKLPALAQASDVAGLEQEVRERLNEFLNKNSSFDEITDYLSDRITQLESDLSKDIEQLHTDAKELSDKRSADNAILNRASANNDLNFNMFNRALMPEHVEELSDKWARTLGVSIDKKALYYTAKRICELESQARGRLATDIQDAVLRSIVAGSVHKNDLKVMEIGTLFGIGAAMIYDHCRERFDNIELTLLDPLEGYYSHQSLDVLTGLRVDESNLRENMEMLRVPEKSYKVIKNYSYEDAAIEEASKQKYDVLIIDADHTYSGVKLDFENYGSMVKRGGYIIFDDYGTPDWPDVKKYVDEEVMPNPNMALVGQSWRTIVFKNIKTRSLAA